MKKRFYLFIFLALSVGVVILLMGMYFLSMNANVVKNVKSAAGSEKGTREMVVIDKNNFAGYLAQNEVISSLPKNAVISLKVDSEYYNVGKGSVVKSKAENPDLEVSIPGSYLPGMGDFCNTVKNAINNGDAKIELKISRVSFLWKYKAVVKYKDCFGF